MRFTVLTLASIVAILAAPAFAREKPNDNGNSQHVDAWHGTGSDHQGNNEPGDTAADRHNFDNDTAGNSDKNPRENANGG